MCSEATENCDLQAMARPDKDHPDTTTLYPDLFARENGLAAFLALDHIGSGEMADEEYPLILITVRIREHYNHGSMTRRSKGIAQVVPIAKAEISIEDTKALNIKDTVTGSQLKKYQHPF